jgi:hypothetical protein
MFHSLVLRFNFRRQINVDLRLPDDFEVALNVYSGFDGASLSPYSIGRLSLWIHLEIVNNGSNSFGSEYDFFRDSPVIIGWYLAS